MIKFLDLHMHSSFSDGDKSPEELIKIAKDKNIDLVALTDHDSIDGIVIAKDAAEKSGIYFISGIELSCLEERDTHVLGYNVDYENIEFTSTLNRLQKAREDRMEKMVRCLLKDGFNVSMSEVAEKSGGKVLGRPHIAAVMVEKGYGKDVRDVFNKYLGRGKKYYVPYEKLGVKEGIELIHSAGGFAVLAHPKLLRYNRRDFIKLLKVYKEFGLDGIEAYYPCHTSDDSEFFLKTANEFGMFVTCGGDYHNDFDSTKNHMGFSASLPGIDRALDILLKGAK